MTATVASFRIAFPEFADGERFPDAMLLNRLMLAPRLMSVERWGTLFDHGVHLYVAHHAALTAQRVKDAAFGKAPGMATGPVSSKGVDKVNVSYDTTTASEDGAGAWNLTVYGQEWFRLSRQFGVGPLQVSGADTPVFSAAYLGPFVPFA